MPDQFRQLKHGESLPGLPRQPWNAMLDRLKAGLGGSPVDGRRTTPVEILVKNTLSDPVPRFAVLGLGGPITGFAQDQGLFFETDAVKGVDPFAGLPFAVMQEPTTADGFNIARVLGLTRVKVDVTDAAHFFADATSDTTHLTSAAAGPAAILWVESDEPGFSGSGSGGGRQTGVQWAVVLLGAGTGGGDVVEIGEPNDTGSGSGSGGPGGLLDWHIVNFTVDPLSASAGEDVWVFDANSL